MSLLGFGFGLCLNRSIDRSQQEGQKPPPGCGHHPVDSFHPARSHTQILPIQQPAHIVAAAWILGARHFFSFAHSPASRAGVSFECTSHPQPPPSTPHLRTPHPSTHPHTPFFQTGHKGRETAARGPCCWWWFVCRSSDPLAVAVPVGSPVPPRQDTSRGKPIGPCSHARTPASTSDRSSRSRVHTSPA